MKMLCVTSNSKLLEQLRRETARLQWELQDARDFAEYSQILHTVEPDIVLADAQDPRIFDWWKKQRPTGLPVVFVTPQPGELRATFDRLERLRGQRHFPKYNLSIDSERQVAKVGTKRLILTMTELRLLRELAGMTFDAVARDVLEGCVFATRGNRRSLDVHICALRKKLKPAGLRLESVRGVGYRLNPCRP